jgi:hypothetical protein
VTIKEIDLIPSELRAIEIHKYYLSQREGREVTLEEAIVDFLINYEADYLRGKQLEDCKEQREEIQKYKWIESEREGCDIGDEKAAEEWINKYSSLWRAEKESLEKNEFLELEIVIENRNDVGIDMAKLAEIARNHDCDLYIHKDRMEYYNFMLFGRKEYLNVKSILCPKHVETARGEKIQFIATGIRCREALDTVERFIHQSD